MNDSELRNHLLAIYNIQKNQLRAIRHLESTMGMLLEKHPDLQERYDTMIREELDAISRRGEPLPEDSGGILIELERVLRRLGNQDLQ